MSRIPLYLTTSRILLVIPTACFLSFQNHLPDGVGQILATLCFIIASITDYYDGFYARKLNAVSNLGKFLDPVADKILVTSVLIVLLHLGRVEAWIIILFVARDTIIGGVRAAAAADGVVLSAQSTGKWKAALQMIAIPFVMLNDLHPQFPSNRIGYGLLQLSVIMSLISGFDYCKSYYLASKRTV